MVELISEMQFCYSTCFDASKVNACSELRCNVTESVMKNPNFSEIAFDRARISLNGMYMSSLKDMRIST